MMQKHCHRVLRSGKTLMAMAVLGLFLAVVSPAPAQVPLKETTDALKQPKPRPPKSVPEPDLNVLLLLGLGVTGLTAYGVHRRKRLA